MGNTSCCCSCSAPQQYYQNVINKLETVTEMSQIHDLISYIENILSLIYQGSNISFSLPSQPNPLTISIASGGSLLEKILKRSDRHICKRDIVPKLDRETRRLCIDVATQVARIQWVGIALSVVGFVLERIEQVSSNREESIQLLRYMCHLAKYIKQLDHHLGNQDKLKRVILFIVQGSLLCISQMRSDRRFSKFFAAPVAAGDLQRLQAQLGHEYSELQLESLIEILNRNEEILNRIPVVLPPSQGISPQAVGVDEAKTLVTKLLDMDNKSVKVVVIYGQGGIGKTTLATVVFSNLHLKNYKYCRVDMEQNCSEADLKVLQQQMLKDLYDSNIELRSLNEGREVLSKNFKESSSKPVFIFIDNALKQSDLEKLLPITALASLPPQSRILITTRNLNETRLVVQEKVDRCPYQVNSLPQQAARKLLCELALSSGQENFDPTIDINGLLEICQGIPLVINLAGARLREHAQNVPACRERVDYLKSWLLGGEEGELSERMVDFVYNRLDASCKEAFLDIVFFFCNWVRDRVVYSVGVTEFEELERAALVNVTDEGRVNVHDIVKARGRMLSRNGERITDLQSLTDVLHDVDSIKKIKGIALNESFELEAHQLNLMKRCLRVLSLTGNMRIVNGECTGAFENLRLLSLHNYNNYSWMDVSKHPRLAAIILTHDEDSNIPKFAGTISSSLRYVYIQGVTLSNLTTRLCQVQSLNCLTLHNCSGINSVPGFTSNLLNLEKLDLRSCSSLGSLPNSFGSLFCLKELDLTSCSSLGSLPNSFGSLSSLKHLNLRCCSSLGSLPNSFGSLSCLKELDLRSCSSLGSLPESFGSLSCLKELYLRSCSSLGSLPNSFGSLSSLEHLNLSFCSSLGSLPNSFGSLSCLKKLYLNSCSSLGSLPESLGNLAFVERLVLEDCKKLTNLPQNFGQLKRLKYVSIHGCSVIQSLSGDFECLSSLIAVKASECPQLEENTMEKLGKMKGLMMVDIDGSPMLKKRWEQVKEQYSLAAVECGIESFLEVMGRAFFHSESKFVHVDENGQVGESPSPAGGEKVWMVLKERDVTSNSKCWEAVKKKWMEMAASEEEGGQMIYVDVGGSWEERERRVEEALPHLPSGAHAWIAPDNRARLLFAHSVQHYYTRHIVRDANLNEESESESESESQSESKLGVGNCIVRTSVCVDEEEEGRRRLHLDDLNFIPPDITPPFAESEEEGFSDQLLSPISDAYGFLNSMYYYY